MRTPAFRNVGPARQNGRILHVLVDERRPSTFYLAPATGGLWTTTNNGTTFTSVLPAMSAVAIGHAALAPSNPDHVSVGTGDAASGRIPLRGFGAQVLLRSVNRGDSWQAISPDLTTNDRTTLKKRSSSVAGPRCHGMRLSSRMVLSMHA